MNIEKIKKRPFAINLILFAFLYLSVSFNKEYIRPIYGKFPIIGILTGSYSNFMAAYIISLFSLALIFKKKLNIMKSKIVFYGVAIAVFIILAFEEIKPFTGASETFDIYDIIASGLGSLLAILTFEIIMRRKKINKNN